MEVNPVAGRIKANEIPLDRLAASSQLSEAEKIAAVSHQFEAVLLRQFLKEAQKPMLKPKGALLGASHDIYQDMIVNHLADEVSKTGMFGLANAFQSQLTSRQNAANETGQRDSPDK
ncbi:MAG: rod-binding protein [Verrucomicrobia bacterium]|nr:rod-binding protein [Verrucomicrobiota bacterium]